MTISGFQGDYRFLSNFWLSPIEYDGLYYPTVEHAYQAAKTESLTDRQAILGATTPGHAKRLGKRVHLRPDWESLKIPTMLGFLRQKFAAPRLQERLLATGEADLVEDNNWGDTFWGVYRGRGENHLGRLLMQVREEILLSVKGGR